MEKAINQTVTINTLMNGEMNVSERDNVSDVDITITSYVISKDKIIDSIKLLFDLHFDMCNDWDRDELTGVSYSQIMQSLKSMQNLSKD